MASLEIQIRRSTAAAWTSTNPVLNLGEPAMETDTGMMKLGDGVSTWTQLNYTAGPITVTAIVLMGSGNPSNGVGVNGDYYIDYVTRNQWGPKASGSWPATPIGPTIVTASSTHTTALSETTICTAGTFNVTLPTPVATGWCRVVNIGTGTITTTTPSGTIYSLSGVSGNQSLVQGTGVLYQSDGTNWYRVA